MLVARFALALVFMIPGVARAQWEGPNLLLTKKRLEDVKQSRDALIVRAREDAVATADGYLGQAPNPIRGVFEVPGYYTSQRARQQEIARQIRGDGRAAHALALAFALTGDAAYADKAHEFIFAWVGSLTEPRDGGRLVDWFLLQHGGDTALVMSYSFPQFLYAYDILRGLGRIDAIDHARFKCWLRPFVAYHSDEEVFKNNHHNWQTLFLLAAAHVTEDRALLDRAVAFYRHGMSKHQIARDGAMWRELVREERAATYTLMAVEAMVQFVHIAENHGVTGLRDLVSGGRGPAEWAILKLRTKLKSTGIPADGGNLSAAFLSLRDFVNVPSSWPARYGRVIKASVVSGPADRSDWGWLFEVAYAWTGDASFLSLMEDAPYGLQPERAYTLSFATLHFRPL